MYRFGPYRIDAKREQVLRGDEVLPLNRKAVQLLTVLAERHGSIVTKEELLDRVWPGQGGTVNNLTQHIFMLRSALEADSQHEPCVLTVPRVGYRFVAPLERADATAADRVLAEHYCSNAAQLAAMHTRGSALCAIDLYTRALTHDERCVEALAGLAHAHVLMADEGYAPAIDALANAAEYAARALHIDVRNVDALIALASARMKREYRWDEAESLLLDAFRAHPRNVNVHVALIEHYIARRDVPRARQALENARPLAADDPYPHLPLLRGLLHYYTGWFDTAVAHFELILDANPHCAVAHLALAKTLIAQREETRARSALEHVLAIAPHPLQAGQRVPRREAMALQVLLKARSVDEYQAEWEDYPPSWYCEAFIALSSGEVQAAVHLMRRSIEQREPLAIFAAEDPLLRPLHPYINYS